MVMKTKISYIILFMLILSAVIADSHAANPQVTLQVSGAVTGNIVLELYPDKAPITVKNFIDYTRSGFYNGLIFHRVISGFMVQGGGFDPNMVKKPATYSQITNESSNGLSNLYGTIAMARTPYPHSATSEFFINQFDNLFLDYGAFSSDSRAILYDSSNPNDPIAYYKAGYCVFGKVISGMNLVNAIAVLPKTGDRPNEDVIIQSASVTLESPFCTEKLAGDVDGDCDVDTEDVFKFATQWLNPECKGCYSADFSGDGNVNFADFAKMAANWLNCTSITSMCN